MKYAYILTGIAYLYFKPHIILSRPTDSFYGKKLLISQHSIKSIVPLKIEERKNKQTNKISENKILKTIYLNLVFILCTLQFFFGFNISILLVLWSHGHAF